jgi:hypothetical protein
MDDLRSVPGDLNAIAESVSRRIDIERPAWQQPYSSRTVVALTAR